MQTGTDSNKKVIRITFLRKSFVFVIIITSISKFTPSNCWGIRKVVLTDLIYYIIQISVITWVPLITCSEILILI